MLNGNSNGLIAKTGWALALLLLTVFLNLGVHFGLISLDTAQKVNLLEDRLGRMEKSLERIEAQGEKK